MSPHPHQKPARSLEEEILSCSLALESRPFCVPPAHLLALAREALALAERLGLSAHPEARAFRLAPSWHTARGLLRFLAYELRRRTGREPSPRAAKRKEGKR